MVKIKDMDEMGDEIADVLRNSVSSGITNEGKKLSLFLTKHPKVTMSDIIANKNILLIVAGIDLEKFLKLKVLRFDFKPTKNHKSFQELETEQ